MRRLQAYFESMCEARAAAEAITEAGIGTAHLDLAGKLDYEFSQEISGIKNYTPAEEGSDQLSTLLMNLWARGLNDGKALASAPGFWHQGLDDCDRGELKISARLVLSVPEESADRASGIIRENGGRIFPSAVL